MSAEFPFTGAAIADATSELEVFREFDWDFTTNTFKRDADGRRIIVEGDDALKVWIFKALQIERYQYLAYSWQYGIELKPFIGLVMTVQERESELERVIVECLMVNPYIRSIDSVTFTVDDDSLTADISLTTVYGEVIIHV